MKAKRDEFSCPCCGEPTDSGYCDACDAFDCGERSVEEAEHFGCLVPRGVKVTRERHAAHYMPGDGHRARGHDLFYIAFRAPKNTTRPHWMPPFAEYHVGFVERGEQWWQYVRKAPLSPGKCPRCAHDAKVTGSRLMGTEVER